MVGRAIRTTLGVTLVLEALNRVLGQPPDRARDQLLIHTDQGSQYRATADRQLLEGCKITLSMSAKGCYWGNTVVDSFFPTLKHELGLEDDAQILKSPQLLIRHLSFWIDGYYKRVRLHSTIGYFSPIDYEHQLINSRTLTSVEP